LKEGIAIAKKRTLNFLQWNALAIVLLIGVLPFATAIITNAGSSSDGTYSSAWKDTGFPPDPSINTNLGYWYENGGENWTFWYQSLLTPAEQTLYADILDCVYIEDGYCSGTDDLTDPYDRFWTRNNVQAGRIPMNAAWTYQTHYYGIDPNYVGQAGSGPYSYFILNNTLGGIEQNETLDKLKITWVDYETTFPCDYSEFVDLHIYGEITFIQDGNSMDSPNIRTKTLKDFEWATSNKYQYNRWDMQNQDYHTVCSPGFELEFDFTGFESLDLTEWNGGDWWGTAYLITLNYIQRADGRNLGSTPLPQNGVNEFYFGIEYQSINTVQANFVIKSLTAGLAFGTFALAIASTPYWDPFKNLLKGVQ
jgi:hypothetical protein